MKVSFDKPGAAPNMAPVIDVEAKVVEANAATGSTQAGPSPAPQTVTAVAIPAPAAPPAPSSPYYDDDAFDASDMVLPRINIVQKVGELSNHYPGGTILLDSKLVLAEAGKAPAPSNPLRIVVLGFQPVLLVEKLEGGVKGKFFRSEQEVAAAGGTLDWNEHKATKKPLYQRSASALLAIEKPEAIKDDSHFPMVVEGKRYAVALYTMKGTAYTNAARHFKTAKNIGHLKATGYRGGFWTFQSLLKEFNGNYAYIPVVKPAEATSEAFRNTVREFIGF